MFLMLLEDEEEEEEEASFSRELNSLDSSSAVASEAFRSSFMLWTGNEPDNNLSLSDNDS